MPKNIEDIIPNKPERRSIRNIPLPEKRRKTDVVTPPISSSEPLPDALYIRTENNPLPRIKLPEHKNITDSTALPRERRRSRKAVWMSALAGLILVVGAGLSLFNSATLSYTPQSFPLSFNKDVYTAYKTDRSGELLFSVIKLSGEKGVEAPATGEEKTSVKASGKIIVYNSGSATSEKLIKNTRFESPEGKIYRTPTDILIPGKQGSTPGSVEITVYADEPGVAHNIGLTDFTVPGLKGDLRFTTIYARSKTPMTGGFVGVVKKVANEDLVKAKASLESSLRDELINEAKAEVPADFVLYPNLIQISYSDLPQSAATASGVTINERADFYGVMFKKDDLATYLAKKKLTTDVSRVNFTDLSSLDISFAGVNSADLLKADQISIEISGSAVAQSVVEESSLIQDLVSVKKSELETVLKKYPGIETAHAVIRPFWKNSFPADTAKIRLVNTLK